MYACQGEGCKVQWKHLYDSEVFQTLSFSGPSWYSPRLIYGIVLRKKSWMSRLKCIISSDGMSHGLYCTSWNHSALFCARKGGLRWANLDAKDDCITAAKRSPLEGTSWGKICFPQCHRAPKSLLLWKKNNSFVCFASEWSLPWWPLVRRIHRHVNYLPNLIQWCFLLWDLIGKPILLQGGEMTVWKG